MKLNYIIFFILLITFKVSAQNDTALKDEDHNFFESAKTGNMELIKKWVEIKKININKADSQGYTALIYSAYYGKEQAVDYLLFQGADPCIKDKRGNSALLGAIFKGNLKIAAKLINAKCSVGQTNNAGQTPLMYATLFGRKEIVKKLIEKGADTKTKDVMGFDALKLAEGQGNEEMINIIKKSEK